MTFRWDKFIAGMQRQAWLGKHGPHIVKAFANFAPSPQEFVCRSKHGRGVEGAGAKRYLQVEGAEISESLKRGNTVGVDLAHLQPQVLQPRQRADLLTRTRTQITSIICSSAWHWHLYSFNE